MKEGERQGTVYVLEDPPPPRRPRWYAHWDGNAAPGFDDIEEAVKWGLARARSVVVRTLGTAFYWAGERPADYNDGEILPWPPSESERLRIDIAYKAALAEALGEQDRRAAYERERAEWLGAHAPELASHEPAHTSLLLLTDDAEEVIEFEEFDAEGVLCGARPCGATVTAFGQIDEVIATVTARAVDDPWIVAMCAALARERTWASNGRRSMLLVKHGEGTMFHATTTANRDSIARHGLDWKRMERSGIAGSAEPELPAIFLCETRDDVGFFTDMSREPTDVWAVRVDGLWLEGDPGASGGGSSNWMIATEPISPERLELVETDIRSRWHG